MLKRYKTNCLTHVNTNSHVHVSPKL